MEGGNNEGKEKKGGLNEWKRESGEQGGCSLEWKHLSLIKTNVHWERVSMFQEDRIESSAQ